MSRELEPGEETAVINVRVTVTMKRLLEIQAHNEWTSVSSLIREGAQWVLEHPQRRRGS